MSKKKPARPSQQALDRQLQELDASWRRMTGTGIQPGGDHLTRFPADAFIKK